MTLINDAELNELFYYAVLVYLGKTINTEDYDFYLEQDFAGNVFIAYWGIVFPTIPSRADIKAVVHYEDTLALSQKPNIYDIAGSRIPILNNTDRTYVKDNLLSYGVAPGTFIYNSDGNSLEVLNELDNWVAIITNGSL